MKHSSEVFVRLEGNILDERLSGSRNQAQAYLPLDRFRCRERWSQRDLVISRLRLTTVILVYTYAMVSMSSGK